jgi:hypothetical protein
MSKPEMVPIEQMTDVELMTEAKKREHADDRKHADELLRYLRMRWRYGNDHNAWPADPDGPTRRAER